jgi:serine protease AprX
LYNALGEKVRTLVSGVEKQGDYSIQFDGSGLPEGTYFLRLASGGNVVSRRIILTH